MTDPEDAIEPVEPEPPPLPARRRRPQRNDQLWRQFVPTLWLIGILVGSTIVGVIYIRVSGNESPWVDAIITAFDAIVVVAFALREREAVLRALSIERTTGKAWLVALATFLAMALVCEAYFYLGQYVFETLEMLEQYREFDWPPWSAVVLIVLCPAIFEELAFRGFLLERLTPLLGKRDALLLQATLFAILHLSPVILPSHFFMGLMLGYIRLRTQSLVPGMIAHGAWNLYVLVDEGLLLGW